MPFQSEKQRRYLHANHPEIAKRWERDYANGGILDIDASEEIIDDDGNDIELTDYNAAFDDPNDLSTGVKSLFRAKDGGRIGLYQGGGPHAGGYGTTSSSSNTGGGGHPHGGVASQYSGSTKSSPSSGRGRTRIQEEKQEEFQKQQFKDVTKGTLSDPHEKYDTGEQHLADTPGDVDSTSPQYNRYKSGLDVKYRQENYDNTLGTQKAALNKWGLGQLGKMGVMLAAMVLMGVPFMDAIKAVPKTVSLSKEDLVNLVKESIPVMKAKKELIDALKNHKGGLLKNVDITNPNEMVNLEETTDFTKTMDQLTELTTTPKDDDTKGDGGIELPPQLGGPSTEEMATEYVNPMWRDNQALYAQLSEKWRQEKADRDAQYKALAEENPIVGTTEMDIIALGNSGGLANLFRVKNQ